MLARNDMDRPTALECRFIRNFCIVAHIDHGKSTLADRLLEFTGTISKREMKEQVLDDMQLERDRGITIKARAVAMKYEYQGQVYEMNLIDTPGHVDFHYEVSRSLSCCEGAVLLVDCTQGVQAQTMANAFAALEQNLEIVPVLNKVDLPNAQPEESKQEMENSLGIDPETVLAVSAKTGLGVGDLLAAVIERMPPPVGDPQATLQAMIFDAHYDEYKGAISYLRLINGSLEKGQKVRFLKAGATYEVLEVGQFVPRMKACSKLQAGQVGYLVCNIKSLGDVHVGDTVTIAGNNPAPALPGYRHPKCMVYCGLYPADGQDFETLRESLAKLSLNDASFEFEPESSDALGFGFRCGFLGLLHMEIIQQRLEREADVDLVQTAPNVTYEIVKNNGETMSIRNPQDVPDSGSIREFRQPMVKINFITPSDCIGPVMQLCGDRRGIYQKTEYLSPTRALLVYEMPLAEVIYDLHDKLKSCTKGYGTMDYELTGYQTADLVRLDILVGGKKVDALSIICHRDDGERRGRAIVKKLRSEIDRHLFEIALQAAIGTRVIARETIAAIRKNVTAKCYGGDITRKRKLWAKQKEGKKRMKSIGSVDIPQKAFLAVLETGNDS